MRLFKSNGDSVPASIEKMARDVKSGQIDRREFLGLASTFGASAVMAYGLIGVALPEHVRAAEPQKGGILRVSMPVQPQKDPRSYDIVDAANLSRCWLEPRLWLAKEWHWGGP
ncbi:hypothetical protein [Mesorhizobium sp.]|uniref:hypothetical protein n=1 Tax=Mesorhizobium sp. TaxID=1871066 RepID=UPI000FEA1781|nr:hypothetical protein [Mesorhizobium sp.]RWE27390.1 MAG: hypothetical protein EOS77_27700 [Mesorhizobium sp.]